MSVTAGDGAGPMPTVEEMLRVGTREEDMLHIRTRGEEGLVRR